MLKLICLSLLVTVIKAAPGYDLHGLGPILAAPPLLPELVYSSPILKAPIFDPGPIFAPAPILKTIAPVAPIIKTVAAPISYATVTKVHIAHPIVKTVLAPQPILKSYFPAPIALGHGFH